MKRIEGLWFAITVKENDTFKDYHRFAKDKDRAEKWGVGTYGKIYGVRKVSADELISSREKSHQRLIDHQQPLGLKITRTVYEVDFDLTEMLLGKPKIDVKNRAKEKHKRLLIEENGY